MNTCATCQGWASQDGQIGSCSLAAIYPWRAGHDLNFCVVGGGDMYAWLQTGAHHGCVKWAPRQADGKPCCWICQWCDHRGPYCEHPSNPEHHSERWFCRDPFDEADCGGTHFEKGQYNPDAR